MTLLVALLVLTDVLLAVVVFLSLLDPAIAEDLAARLSGLRRQRERDQLSEQEAAHLRWAATWLPRLLLVLLLAWSFVIGVLMTASRLP